MAGQKQDDQHEHTFSSYMRIRDVVQKTCPGRWTIGRSGERGSGISVLPARHDDDDDDDIYIYIYIFLSISLTLSLSLYIYIYILLWTQSHEQKKTGRPARTYTQQHCANTGCSLEVLRGVMDDKDGWQEMFIEIRAGNTTWWLWYIYIYI